MNIALYDVSVAITSHEAAHGFVAHRLGGGWRWPGRPPTSSWRRSWLWRFGLLPNVLAYPLSRLELNGMLILIGILIVLPLAGTRFGLNLDVISAILRTSTGTVIRLLLLLTGNT